MDAVVHVFTGSLCVTAMSMLNPADARTNIKLAEEHKEYAF